MASIPEFRGEVALDTVKENTSSSTDSEESEDDHSTVASDGVKLGKNLDAIKIGENVDCAMVHQVETERSILALLVDDDYLIAGLEGGDIVVGLDDVFCPSSTPPLADFFRG